MANKEIVAVYTAGLIQGVALVAFPAASMIFTSPYAFHFSNTAYGGLFIPQTILSILSALLCMRLNQYMTAKSVFSIGLGANLLSMLLLSLSAFLMHDSMAYPFLLCATGCLGIGFGLTVPTLNTLAARLYPKRVEVVILTLNALLGIGTALAPAFIALFIGLGFWWGLPVTVALCLIFLLFFTTCLSLPGESSKSVTPAGRVIPPFFWIFAIAAVLYGMVETLNGNWLTLYMRTQVQASSLLQAMTLSLFWAMVTGGRIFFAFMEKRLSASAVYCFLPLVCLAAFLCAAFLPANAPFLGMLTFGLAGFGCSALLPLTISISRAQLPSMAESVAGGIIAFYLLGYGIAAFGVGPLQETFHFTLKDVYLSGAGVAVLLALLCIRIIPDRGAPLSGIN